jgi:CelD/BcsL family acetyltransferase involved in cellulose biosynthesis
VEFTFVHPGSAHQKAPRCSLPTESCVTGLPGTIDRTSTALQFEAAPIDVGGFAEREDEWRRLEKEAANDSVYTTYDWLRAWTDVCQPRRLQIMRAVRRDGGGTAALGLLDIDGIRGWRFAGGGLTPRRAPLCVRGCEDDMWKALAEWLRTHRRAWSTLEASEVAPAAAAVPRASLSEQTVPCLAVPDSFDAYLASLSSRRRHELRRRLARTEEAGIEVREVVPASVESALADFVHLYERRAAVVGRSRLDERLVALLGCFLGGSPIELHVFEVLDGRTRLGVSLDLVHNDGYFPYSLAWAPEAAHLAPGILLTVNVIRYAIARGLRVIDLGPGGQSYKLALGFIPETRLTLHAVNRSLWAKSMTAAGAIYSRLRP